MQEYSQEFQELLKNVEAALIKAGHNARKLAEQTGTKFVIVEIVPTNAANMHSNVVTQNNILKKAL